MKLVPVHPMVSFDKIFDNFKLSSDDPAWVYGDRLLNDYLEINNPKLKEWMCRSDIRCVSCESERNKDPNGFSTGCQFCWNNECEMMRLSEKFHEQAKLTIHLLSPDEISLMRKNYIEKFGEDI